MPFGCFATTRIERIVVAHPQGRGEGGVVCGDAAQQGEVKDGGVRECEQVLVDGGV